MEGEALPSPPSEPHSLLPELPGPGGRQILSGLRKHQRSHQPVQPAVGSARGEMSCSWPPQRCWPGPSLSPQGCGQSSLSRRLWPREPAVTSGAPVSLRCTCTCSGESGSLTMAVTTPPPALDRPASAQSSWGISDFEGHWGGARGGLAVPRRLVSGNGVVCARRWLPSLGSLTGSQAQGGPFSAKNKAGRTPLGSWL